MPFTPTNFTNPDQTVEPFIAPAGATAQPVSPGGPPSQVRPENYSLFCTLQGAQLLLPQYVQAAKMRRLAISVSLVDGIANGSYGMYSRAADGATIWVVTGAVTDSTGNESEIADVAGEMLSRYMFPFTPGMPYYGDTNYKEEIPIINGVQQPQDTQDVQVPGYLELVVGEGSAQGRWVAGLAS